VEGKMSTASFLTSQKPRYSDIARSQVSLYILSPWISWHGASLPKRGVSRPICRRRSCRRLYRVTRRSAPQRIRRTSAFHSHRTTCCDAIDTRRLTPFYSRF